MTAYEQFMSWRLRRRSAKNHSIEPEHTAQAAYKSMIDGVVSPSLRAWGMKGSGGRYELPSTTHWALLGFQKSAYSDSQTIRFTINLFVVERAVWEREAASRPHWGKKPAASRGYTRELSPARIGQVAGGEDTWWTISAKANTRPVADAVLSIIESAGLPWLRERIRRD